MVAHTTEHVAHTPVILGLGRLKWKDWEFGTSLSTVTLLKGREGRRNWRKDTAEESSVSRMRAPASLSSVPALGGGDRWTLWLAGPAGPAGPSLIS